MQGGIRPIVSLPGYGRRIHAIGTHLTIRVSSRDSGGAFAVWEEEAAPGYGPPRHIHYRLDEVFQILEGRYQVWCVGLSYELEPGGMAMIPKGTPHAFRCLGPAQGRMLTTVVPGGLDAFFIEIERLGLKLPDEMARVIELGEAHGHEFVGPPLSESSFG